MALLPGCFWKAAERESNLAYKKTKKKSLQHYIDCNKNNSNYYKRSHALTVLGAISVRLLDVYKQGRENIHVLETQNPLKNVLTSLHIPG